MIRVDNIACINNELAIVWSDQEESYISLEALRKACPCANCQGEPDATGRVVRPKVVHGAGSFMLSRWEVVGGYAVQFMWRDGHSTGIYSYDYLRRLGAN